MAHLINYFSQFKAINVCLTKCLARKYVSSCIVVISALKSNTPCHNSKVKADLLCLNLQTQYNVSHEHLFAYYQYRHKYLSKIHRCINK